MDDVYNDLPVRVHLVGCDRGGLYEEHLEDIQKLQKYRGKLEVLNKEIEHHKSSKDLFLKKTFFLKEHGDFSNAEQILIELINAYPSDDELFSELAELSYQRGEKMSLLGYYDEVTIRKKMKSQSYREALNYSEKALSINPGNGKAKYINIAAKSYLDEETNGGLR
ncbi:MAG: hypothetical protein HYU57_05775 [Micavibrio aeruginosavorus]|nr:hypothetical protein [Micavibrio aeruginosavorus]